MATLDEIWSGLADGTMERPDQAAILRVLVTRARSTAASSDPQERSNALSVARVIGGPEAVEVYREYANDSDQSVREKMFEFAKEAGAMGLPAIRAMVKDADPILNHKVLELLFDQNDPQSGTAVRGLLTDASALRRAWAALIIGSTAGASMVIRVNPLLNDEEESVQAAAKWAVAKMNREDVGDAPRPNVDETKKSAKKKALPVPVANETEPSDAEPPPRYNFEDILAFFKTVGESQEPDVVVKHIRTYDDQALSAGLRDAASANITPAVKRGAALAAGRTGNTRWAGNLRRMISDANPGVRAAVAEALGQLCTNAVSIQLSSLLRDEHPAVRASAAKALATGASKINSEEWAIQLLRAAKDDQDEDVRQSIQDAISALEA